MINEYSKDEWRDITRRLKPDWTDEQFEKAWSEFQEIKKQLKDVGGSA